MCLASLTQNIVQTMYFAEHYKLIAWQVTVSRAMHCCNCDIYSKKVDAIREIAKSVHFPLQIICSLGLYPPNPTWHAQHDMTHDTTENRNVSTWICHVVGHRTVSCRTIHSAYSLCNLSCFYFFVVLYRVSWPGGHMTSQNVCFNLGWWYKVAVSKK